MFKSIFKVIESLVYAKIFWLSDPEVRRDDDEEEKEVSNYYDSVPLLSSGSDNHQRCFDVHTVRVPMGVAGPGDDDDKWGEQIQHPAAPTPFPGSSDHLDKIVVEVENIYKILMKEDYNKSIIRQSWNLGGVVPTSTSTNSTSKAVVVCETAAALDLDDRNEDQCSIVPIKNEKRKNRRKVKKKKSCSSIDSFLYPNPNPLGQTTQSHRCEYDVLSVRGKDKQQHIQNITGSTTSNAIIRGDKTNTTSSHLLLHHLCYLGQAQYGWSVNEESTTKQHHIHNVNTNGGQKNKTTAAATNGIIKWVGLYNSSQSILAVGEGDFSFSASLAAVFGSASKMIATSLNKEKFLFENCSRAELNIFQLRKRGCVVKHMVNATTMARDKLLRSRKFDRIIYNFPHAGFTSKSESKKVQISEHQALVRGFLANAKMMIEKNGQVHITHKCNGFHIDWNIVALACSQGLELLEEVPFNHRNYPSYLTKYGFGGDGNFCCYPSKTYIFVLKD